MSHSSGYRKYEDNECSGPRPPVPGEESRVKKMTEEVTDIARSSPPSYLNWARTLNHLLEDSDGVNLFVKYVAEEMPAYNDHLNFFFACEGLKQQTNPKKINKIIGAINDKFLDRNGKFSKYKELHDTIRANLKNKIPLSPQIFDCVQQNVEVTIRDKIYPTFLVSEMYIGYIQQMSAAHERYSTTTTTTTGSGGSSSGSGCGEAGACALPTKLNTNVNTTTTTTTSTTLVGISTTTSKAPYNTSPFVLPANSSSSSSASCNVAPNIGTPGGSNYAPSLPAPGTCSASGSVYGPSTSASSSGSISATDTLPRSSTLPTLHEDTELSLCDDFEKLRVESGGGRMSADMPLRLTRDLLLVTQQRRLEMRPPGAHGYQYTVNINASYVPNSRVDSERASISSGGRTDSDTMSLSSCSMDGRPYKQRRDRTTESKAIRQNAMANRETNNSQVIPRTQRLHSNEHRPLPKAEFIALLFPKLEEIKRQQELEERAQTILDNHVKLVWKDETPTASPGTMSPRPPLPSRRRTITHDSGMLSDGAMSISGHSMKHSKSMPDHSSSSRKLTNKWPSMNTDSGISLTSADTLMKYKDSSSSRSGSSTASKLERRLEDETRRLRHSTQQLLPPQLPAFSSSSSGSSSLHHQPPPPPLPAKPYEPTTSALYYFCDESVPFKVALPGTQPTLKQFKDCLPKKGNFRFYFQTHFEDPVNQEKILIQEEIKNDADILPLLEGKVRGLVMPSD